MYRVGVTCSEEKVLRVDDIQQPTTSGADDAEATFTTDTSLGDEIAATAAENSRRDELNHSAVSTSTPDHTPRGRTLMLSYTCTRTFHVHVYLHVCVYVNPYVIYTCTAYLFSYIIHVASKYLYTCTLTLQCRRRAVWRCLLFVTSRQPPQPAVRARAVSPSRRFAPTRRRRPASRRRQCHRPASGSAGVRSQTRARCQHSSSASRRSSAR